ncbi:hypothetical protein H4R18_000384 [Coemansia javaensis]|uniref:Uncharacterized protein n=1 Tax=Coemansia javaensis TaxID=2761396 RepID=A0A9W8HII0_9FUNG|nr:hypothetical protein H4R18_000384 [Coemansia javaensis]
MIAVAVRAAGRLPAGWARRGQLRGYTDTAIPGRSQLLPWVLPSKADSIPKPRLRTNDVPPAVATNMCEAFGAVHYMFAPKRYMAVVERSAIPQVLASVADAVSSQDCDAFDRLMTPALAEQYKARVREQQAGGYRIEVALANIRNAEMRGFEFVHGPPEAFDDSVPYQERRKHFDVFQGYFYRFARPGTGGTVTFESWALRMPYYFLARPVRRNVFFTVDADVTVSRIEPGKPTATDSGSMTIPMMLSTPTYPSLFRFPMVAEDGSVARRVRPLEWRVGDMFRFFGHW